MLPKRALIVCALLLAGCNNEPAHHYVFCSDTDDGWKLVDSKKDENGYLIACTFQSPDMTQVRTDVCTSSGCD